MACKRSSVRSRLAPPSKEKQNTRVGGIAQLGEHLLCKQRVYGSIPYTSTNTQECGVIAQLGERLHGMQEVIGSIPISSTKQRKTKH